MKSSPLKGKFAAVGLGVACICLIGVVAYSSQKTKEAERLDATAQAIAKTQTLKAGPRVLTPREQFEQHMNFERDTRRFLRDQASWSPQERQERARELTLRIDEREKSKYLSAGEALKLKMMLIRAIEPDEQQQSAQIADLILRYQARAERQQAEFLATQQRDPRFQSYKAREAQIVAEVQAMRSFPGGMSRSEYLRQRLLEARAAIYYTPQSGQAIPLEPTPGR